MLKTVSASRFGALFALVMALVFGCACAALPASAYAADLVSGSYVVNQEMSAPTVAEVVSTGAGKLAVKVNYGYSNGGGYEFQVSPSAAFTKYVSASVNTTLDNTSKVFSGLSKGKKYFVRVRQYATYEGQTVCTPWSSAKSATVAIKGKSSKIKGVWKITGSNVKSLSTIIKRNKRISSKAKATLTFKNNGVILLTDYDKSKTKLTNSWGKWVALSKTKGQTIKSGSKLATIKVKGKKLTLSAGGSKIYCQKL